tara:strand:- start:209 stop:604 length:396 start_codon:yes stop_codon:yes gene_type:complete
MGDQRPGKFSNIRFEVVGTGVKVDTGRCREVALQSLGCEFCCKETLLLQGGPWQRHVDVSKIFLSSAIGACDTPVGRFVKSRGGKVLAITEMSRFARGRWKIERLLGSARHACVIPAQEESVEGQFHSGRI